MFYVKTLEHEIVLEPIHFGPKLKSTLVRLLKEEVEGLALANYGYVVQVIDVPEDQIRFGIIEYDTGDVVCYVKYIALLLRPFINEVLDATVSQCNQLGFFAFVVAFGGFGRGFRVGVVCVGVFSLLSLHL